MAQRPGTRKACLWLKRIRQWQQSQLGVRDFCQRRRLSEPSFYSWRRILRQRGLIGDSAQATPVVSAPAFVKVVVNADAPPAPAIDLVLGKGRLLRVRPGFDAELLQQLLRVLEEPSC